MKTAFVFFWLLIIILVTSWFFLKPGMFYLHDYLHTARVAEMADALKDGHFPVRWSRDFGYGYGMPLFEFYAPLPFYIGALLAMIGLPLLVVTKALFVICNIGTTVGSYYLGKSWYGRIGGLLTAAAISLAPYRAVNLYVRGALSESWGVLAIVWIIYFLWHTARGMKFGWVGLTLSLAVLFLSHNLLTLIFTPFSAMLAVIFLAYVAYKNNVKNIWARALAIGGSYVLALAMSAFYMVPAYLEKGLTQVEKITLATYFDYTNHFVYLRQFATPNWGYGGSTWGLFDGISFFLGYGQLVVTMLSFVVLLAAGYLVLMRMKSPISKARVLLTGGVFALLFSSLLLATEKSLIIWNAIPLLQYLQFPWRFLSIALVLIGLVAPFFLLSQKSFIYRWSLGFVMVLLCFANAVYFKPMGQLENPTQYYTGDPQVIRTDLSDTLPDYLPASARERMSSNVLAECTNECQVTTQSDLVHKKSISVQSNQPTQVVFSVNHFPGWISTVNGTTVEAKIVEGLIAIEVPAGQSEVTTEFTGTQLRSSMDIMSAAAFVLFASVAVYQRRKTNGK